MRILDVSNAIVHQPVCQGHEAGRAHRQGMLAEILPVLGCFQAVQSGVQDLGLQLDRAHSVQPNWGVARWCLVSSFGLLAGVPD